MASLPHSNTLETFDFGAGGGLREDLSDIIYSISPTETPFMMMCGRGSATSTKHEWLSDELATAAANFKEEGDDPDAVAAVSPVRFANQMQISEKTISITGTMEVVDKAGRQSELSYQLAKRAKEIKRDLEFTMVGQTTVADMKSVVAVSSTAGRSAAVQAIFHTAMEQGGQALDGIHVNLGAGAGATGGFDGTVFDAPTSGTERPLLESQLKGVIQGAWTNGGDPSVIICGPFNKTVISGFSGNSTRFDRGEDKRLVAAIDVYVSDFGEHRVVPDRFSSADNVFAFTPELWSVDYLRPFRQHALAKTGDAENRQILCEWTLKAGNHAGSGWVGDLTTA